MKGRAAVAALVMLAGCTYHPILPKDHKVTLLYVALGDSTTRVQLVIQDNPGNAQFVDAITGAIIDTPLTARLVQGVARFTAPSGNPLALNKAGIGYTLGVEAIDNDALLPATSNAFVVTATGEVDGVRYGKVLRARKLVGVRGAGTSYDGFYYVRRVTHTLRPGEYRQSFTLSRDGTGALLPVVAP